jgi:hypothetical protein
MLLRRKSFSLAGYDQITTLRIIKEISNITKRLLLGRTPIKYRLLYVRAYSPGRQLFFPQHAFW